MSESQQTSSEQEDSSSHSGKRFGVGLSIDWDSPLVPIAMAVELPFWLLMPSGQINVSVDGVTVDVIVENAGIEIQHGHQFTRTHQNTVFVGSEQALHNATFPARALPGGGILRGTRTLLFLDAYACSDAVEAFFGSDGPRFQDGSRYMASLAVGQLRVVNSLVNAYRRATVDPFANEVTAWDLPVWFVVSPPRTQPVCCYAHLVDDWFPTIRSFGKPASERPIFTTSPDEVARQLEADEIPGEIELLDGWSLFHRGRFGDAIRSFVTAVEVLLEAQICRLLKSQGASSSDIEARLAGTRTNFEKRMLDYCGLSKRRVPGPKLHPVPYVNGTRLLDEMSNCRRLRHQIVHHGHRLDQNYEKLMLRAAETTTWLFDWLSDGGGFEDRRQVHSTLFFSFRTSQSMFPCDIVDGKIVVVKPGYIAEPDPKEFDGLLFGQVIYSEQLYFRTISPSSSDGKDIEHFVQMSLFELGLGEIEDSEFAPKEDLTTERFFFQWNGRRIGVHLLDVPEQLDESHITRLSQSLDERGIPDESVRAILVSNDQMLNDWTVRTPLNSHHSELAKSRGISLLSTPELARLVVSSMRLKWSKRLIAEDICNCGPGKLMPPAGILLGLVYKHWPKAGVLGVIPSTGVAVSIGDTLAIELKTQFIEATVSDTKVDEAGKLTVKIDVGDVSIRTDARVFLLDRSRSYQPPEGNPETTIPPAAVMACGAVHSSRAQLKRSS
jgi:hypothetical protein